MTATRLGPVTRALLALGSALTVAAWWVSRPPPTLPPGDAQRLAEVCRLPALGPAEAPIQRDDVPMAPAFALGEHRLTPRAAFAVDAVVLGAERYRFGREAALSPLDLALGWGPMADPAVHGALGITQSGRWYHYRWGPEGPPIPAAAIVSHSSNLHMIPSDAATATRLLRITPGARVRLAGWLVDVETTDGFRWSTSLRRDDTGDGACEIVYVCEVATLP